MIKRKGFTVIELVIAMTVVIVLLGLGTVGFRSSRAHYRDREREADVQAIAAYLEQIYPKEIKNADGKVIKEAGTYPALAEENDDWTPERLQARQKQLANLATTVWRVAQLS